MKMNLKKAAAFVLGAGMVFAAASVPAMAEESKALNICIITSTGVDDGSFNLSLEWRGNYGNFSNIWSVTSMGADGIIGNPALMLIALGQRYTAGDFTFGLDWFSQSGDENAILLNGSSFLGSVSWDPSESLSVLLKGGLEKANELLDDGITASQRFGNNYFGGAALHWFPVEGLRLHAMGAYHSFWKTTSFSVGATYYLNL